MKLGVFSKHEINFTSLASPTVYVRVYDTDTSFRSKSNLYSKLRVRNVPFNALLWVWCKKCFSENEGSRIGISPSANAHWDDGMMAENKTQFTIIQQ